MKNNPNKQEKRNTPNAVIPFNQPIFDKLKLLHQFFFKIHNQYFNIHHFKINLFIKIGDLENI